MSGLNGLSRRRGYADIARRAPAALRRRQRVLEALAVGACILSSIIAMPSARADWMPAPGGGDPRIRVAPYSSTRVYRLYGYVGYQIDIEFARGERFKGLAAGNIEGIAFKADGRHLFIKPRVTRLRTNLTVLTNLRAYEFDYSVSSGTPNPSTEPVIYALRFSYPRSPVAAMPHVKERISRDLAHGPVAARNFDYGYCGSPSLKPEAVWDNGVQTWIRFGARQALPAIFVLGADGSESLVNFSVHRGDVVVQCVVRRLVLRRGKLEGCIVNEAFRGAGVQLRSETVSPKVDRLAVR